MIYQIKSYIKFILRSKNQHGIHSPFVYDLATKCFYDKTKNDKYQVLRQHRNKLLSSSETITVTDFGAGSRVFKSNSRSVSAIAKNAGITEKRQRLLFRLVRYFQPESIFELGTSLGMATLAMAIANPSARVTTVEGCPKTARIAEAYFDTFKLQNITLISERFEDFFATVPSDKYQFVYIDGSHTKEMTLQNFNFLLKHLKNETVLIFDDIYWSKQMSEAWTEIINHPEVTVSIDTFYWGFVFFRKEQKKQHFTIRL